MQPVFCWKDFFRPEKKNNGKIIGIYIEINTLSKCTGK